MISETSAPTTADWSPNSADAVVSADGSRHPLVGEIERLRGELAAAHNKIANLEIALLSNREIGAAIGILMNQHQLSLDAAFSLLREASQHTHRKLREVASEVLYTGALDAHRNN